MDGETLMKCSEAEKTVNQSLVSLRYIIKTAVAASRIQRDDAILSFILDSSFAGRCPESLDRYISRSSDTKMTLLTLRELEGHMKNFDEHCWEILFTFMLHLN